MKRNISIKRVTRLNIATIIFSLFVSSFVNAFAAPVGQNKRKPSDDAQPSTMRLKIMDVLTGMPLANRAVTFSDGYHRLDDLTWTGKTDTNGFVVVPTEFILLTDPDIGIESCKMNGAELLVELLPDGTCYGRLFPQMVPSVEVLISLLDNSDPYIRSYASSIAMIMLPDKYDGNLSVTEKELLKVNKAKISRECGKSLTDLLNYPNKLMRKRNIGYVFIYYVLFWGGNFQDEFGGDLQFQDFLVSFTPAFLKALAESLQDDDKEVKLAAQAVLTGLFFDDNGTLTALSESLEKHSDEATRQLIHKLREAQVSRSK